jgi:hypothetical protein
VFGVSQGVFADEFEIWGGDGHDGINLAEPSGDVWMDLGGGDDGASMPTSRTTGVEIHGSAGHDLISGAQGDDVLAGEAVRTSSTRGGRHRGRRGRRPSLGQHRQLRR